MMARSITTVALALLMPVAAHAAGDPFVGTWRLDKPKSIIAHDPGVKSKEISFTPAADGVLITETLEMMSESGKKQVSYLSYIYGKFTPQARPDLDAFSAVKTGSNQMLWVAQLKGKTIARLQLDLSSDGKELTFRYLSAASDPTGAVTKDRYVYDRQ